MESRRAPFQRLLARHQVLDLRQEPRIDVGQAEYFCLAHAGAQGIGDVPDALRAGIAQLGFDGFAVGGLLVEPVAADFQPAQRLLQRLLEGAADRHHLAHRLHLRGEAAVGLRKFLEGEARNLGDDVIDRRLERGRGRAAGDVVLQLVQGVADRQLGRHLGDREAGRLGRQRGGARHARVHLDHHHAAVVRVDGELHVGAAGFHADLAQHRDARRCA